MKTLGAGLTSVSYTHLDVYKRQDRITAVKTTDSGLIAVEFLEYIGADQQIPLFTIYCATGSLREYYAAGPT